jgi:hypothetical protein
MTNIESGHKNETNEAEERRKGLLRTRDIYREHSNELEKNIAEVQGAKLETALLILMKRSDDNPELINNLNALLDALLHQANFGKSDELLGKGRREELTAWLEEKSEELRWDVGPGGRKADRKPTWEGKK